MEIRDLDKTTTLRRTWLDNYAHLIDYPTKHVFKFTATELATLVEASRIGQISMRRPSYMDFEEDLLQIENRIAESIPFDRDYFIRLSSASPKDGLPNMPICSASDVVNVLCTSRRAHLAMSGGCDTLYFVEWNPEMSQASEVRVFVNKGRVCAIGQYDWTRSNWFHTLSDSDLESLGHQIIKYTSSGVNKVSDHIGTDSMVVDIWIRKDLSLQVIELNSFGYWLCSGACCFNWTADREKMYGRLGNKVFFRIVSPGCSD